LNPVAYVGIKTRFVHIPSVAAYVKVDNPIGHDPGAAGNRLADPIMR